MAWLLVGLIEEAHKELHGFALVKVQGINA
jgi:hypothetical protein